MGDRDRMTAEQLELWERIEEVRPAMMTTADQGGSFRSRPMWTQGDGFDGSLWFFVSDEGPLARELQRNPRVGLSYSAPDKDLYLSVSGSPNSPGQSEGRQAVEYVRRGVVSGWHRRSEPRPSASGGRACPVLGRQEAQGAAVRRDRDRCPDRLASEKR